MPNSPSSTRSNPPRGRGRGRPRLNRPGGSLMGSRRSSGTLQKHSEKTPGSTRRRPVYQNGYRPGGAGGGGRYIHPETGQQIPAYVYNALKSSSSNSTPRLPPPQSFSSDGVFKPREERSYTEFHPTFDLDQILRVYSAQEVDGENYKPPEPMKSVKIAENVDDEPILNGQMTPATNGGENIKLSNGINARELQVRTATVDHKDDSIDSSLAALTPPPVPGKLDSIHPTDSAAAQVQQAPHAQMQTPAITPTETFLNEIGEQSSASPPATPAPVSERRGKDVPTLASLRPHRSNVRKSPPRSAPPPSRRSRARNKENTWEEQSLHLPKPEYRKIKPFQFSEIAWSSEVGSTGPRGINNPNASPGGFSEEMISLGYQKTTIFRQPHTYLRDHLDVGIDEELGSKEITNRVEYDMDEQDDKWLTGLNSTRLVERKSAVTRELFEITMTKIEKEWVALEKRMPKVAAKAHGSSSHRRRVSGRLGEDDEDEDEEGGEDSKCAICDDGECENSNAIVFCDGCDLAVHQECYGVPYIPEGQWLCRKCLTIPRQTAHCVFCPNTDGAFKQTSTNRWSHLLCAIWIPEVRLANPAYMEPVDGIELVPKSRWKLYCYICKQRMGACIQCSNKSCFIAFHVTCGRRARLHMKMKNSTGPGAQLESSGLKAYCDKHVPADWRRENNVDEATREAMSFYARTMAGRVWGDPQLAATALPSSPPDEEMGDSHDALRLNLTVGNKRKRIAQPPKNIWKLTTGAPVIPHILYREIVESLSQFQIDDINGYTAEACKYWTLKREARRGASLLKRLQLQMDSFTSVEVTRKNYAAMGRTIGTKKLDRRKEYAESVSNDLNGLIGVVKEVRKREDEKVVEAQALKEFVDTYYFPEVPLMRRVLDIAQRLDIDRVYEFGFDLIRDRIENRLYPNVSAFTSDIRSVLQSSPISPHLSYTVQVLDYIPPQLFSTTRRNSEQREYEAVGRNLLSNLQSLLEDAKREEAEIRKTPGERFGKRPRLNGMTDSKKVNGLLPDAVPHNTGHDRDSLTRPYSPSAQLVKEASPENLRRIVSPSPVPTTIIGKLATKLTSSVLMGQWDIETTTWHEREFKPAGLDTQSEAEQGEERNGDSPSPYSPEPRDDAELGQVIIETVSEERLQEQVEEESLPMSLSEPQPPAISIIAGTAEEDTRINEGVGESTPKEDEEMEDAPGEEDDEMVDFPFQQDDMSVIPEVKSTITETMEKPVEEPVVESEETVPEPRAEIMVETIKETETVLIEETLEEPTEKLHERPVEEPTEEPIEESVEEPAEEPTEEPMKTPVEKPLEMPAEELLETPMEAPMEVPMEVPMEETVEQPVEKLMKETVTAPVENTAKENMEEAGEENIEEKVPKAVVPETISDVIPDPGDESSELSEADAEGESDDEIPLPPLPIPEVKKPLAYHAAMEQRPPKIDPTKDDAGNLEKLLVGYRPEDLPSPLGGDISDIGSPLIESSQSRQFNSEPNLPQDILGPPSLPLETLTNTSVLSDPPDDVGVGIGKTKSRNSRSSARARNQASSALRKDSKTFARQSNGRFGKAAPKPRTKRRK